MKNLLVCSVALLVLVGCEPSHQDIRRAKAITEASSANPQVMTKLPDGREVQRIVVQEAGEFAHYVYFIDGAQVTANYNVPNGKGQRVMTVSQLGGLTVAEYRAKTEAEIAEYEAQQLRDAEKELKQAQEAYNAVLRQGAK